MNGKNEKKRVLNELRVPMLILILGVLLTFIAPPLLTLPSFKQCFNFSETGNIGDTIGGITSPIVGLVGAVLMFYSIYLQFEANKQQNKAMRDQYCIGFINDSFKEIWDFLREIDKDNNKYFVNVLFITTQLEGLAKFIDGLDQTFIQLDSYKRKYINGVNVCIENPAVCNVIERCVPSNGDFPINHLVKINEVIKNWGEEYNNISFLDSFISKINETLLDYEKDELNDLI